jgi:hypothetical protein
MSKGDGFNIGINDGTAAGLDKIGKAKCNNAKPDPKAEIQGRATSYNTGIRVFSETFLK